MERYFQTFETQKKRKEWIQDMQKKHSNFRVCFCEPTDTYSDKKLFEASGVNTNVMKYACIYRLEGEQA